jgi:L-serine dehydratase
MRAAAAFAAELTRADLLSRIDRVEVHLYGSLAATGRGHGTFPAILLGLEGAEPDVILPDHVASRSLVHRTEGTVLVGGVTPIQLTEDQFFLHLLTVLPGHSNGMTLCAFDDGGTAMRRVTYYSVGGGFVERDGNDDTLAVAEENLPAVSIPFPFRTAAELLAHCERETLPLSGVMLANELAMRPANTVAEYLTTIREVMEECCAAGISSSGELPGGLRVRRRAPRWHADLLVDDPDQDPRFWQDWVNLVAMAVNEENAAGGRVVTAPTNGAAGIIPAVLHYALSYTNNVRDASALARAEIAARFLLTAGAVGVLYKEQASISGADVGCQGEVGSASSMAAAGLAEILGGTPLQVENAAEIAMEHNLGLTCDPVGGLVQIPCIERNAIAAAKAINAAQMAMRGDGDHRVSLDQVILTMRETGHDMNSKYKETSRGGLAVNVTEC